MTDTCPVFKDSKKKNECLRTDKSLIIMKWDKIEEGCVFKAYYALYSS